MKEPISVLEIFLLFCAKIGLGTTYLIMSHLGVGTGAIGDLLRGLEKRGLLTVSPGPRRQLFFSLTQKGELLLLDVLVRKPIDWKSAASGYYEGLPRVIFFSWIRGQLDDARAAVDLVETSLMKKARRADLVVKEARKTLFPPPNAKLTKEENVSPEYLTTAFRFITAVSHAAQAKQKAGALVELRQAIDRLPPTPKTFLQGHSGEVSDGTDDSESALPQKN